MVRSVSAAPGAPSCRERAGSRAERPIVDRGVAPPSRQVMVFEPDADGLVRRPDQLAVEEPLQIRLRTPAGTSTLAVTMRTPGSDMELVAGLLLAEGIVDGPDDLAGLTTCLGDEASGGQRYNVVTAALRGPPRQLGRERTLVTSSACGVCGTTSVDAVVGAGWPTLPTGPVMPLAWVVALPELLREIHQSYPEIPPGKRLFRVTFEWPWPPATRPATLETPSLPQSAPPCTSAAKRRPSLARDLAGPDTTPAITANPPTCLTATAAQRAAVKSWVLSQMEANK